VDGNATDLVERDIRTLERFFDDGQKVANVGTRGDLRHDPAETRVKFGLRRDHVRENLQVGIEHRRRSLIARRFERQE